MHKAADGPQAHSLDKRCQTGHLFPRGSAFSGQLSPPGAVWIPSRRRRNCHRCRVAWAHDRFLRFSKSFDRQGRENITFQIGQRFFFMTAQAHFQFGSQFCLSLPISVRGPDKCRGNSCERKKGQGCLLGTAPVSSSPLFISKRGREVTLSRHVSSGKIRMIAQRVSVDQPSLWAVV